MATGIGKRARRWLHLGHRWLGIVTGLFFAVWLGSGLVMMYVAFPALTEPERRAGLPPLDWDAVRVDPDAALAGEDGFPHRFTLSMRDGEPLYRIERWDGTSHALSARDGRPVAGVDAGRSVAIAGHDPRAVRPVLLDTIARDVWSVHQRYDAARPLHRIALGDRDRTELYVSAATGAVVLDTDRRARIWNWFGAIPHWLYVTPLRADAALWRAVVLWLSGIAIAAALSGFVLGLMRTRLRRRYPSGSVSPYRGLARLHHLGGIVGGVALLSFILSGWVSMNPNRWFSSRSPAPAMLRTYAAAPGPRTGLAPSAIRAAACAETAEIRFTWLGGEPLAVAACRDGRDVPVHAGAALSDTRLARMARGLLPGAALIAFDRLSAEDVYWYGHHASRPLPVLRAVFDDPAATWFHLDPATGAVLDRLDRSGRAHRWLFNLMHSFDLGPLLRNRPAWDGLVILLLAAGLVVTGPGLVLGWRRLRRAGPPRTT